MLSNVQFSYIGFTFFNIFYFAWLGTYPSLGNFWRGENHRSQPVGSPAAIYLYIGQKRASATSIQVRLNLSFSIS